MLSREKFSSHEGRATTTFLWGAEEGEWSTVRVQWPSSKFTTGCGQKQLQSHPMQKIDTTRATPTATPLMIISSGGGGSLGCSRLLLEGFFLVTILTPALELGQRITKCTLAILIGMSNVTFVQKSFSILRANTIATSWPTTAAQVLDGPSYPCASVKVLNLR